MKVVGPTYQDHPVQHFVYTTHSKFPIWMTQTCQPSRFWQDSPAFLPDVPRPAKSWKCPAFCTKSDLFARAQFVTLPRCPDVNAYHPIERNYGKSVQFHAKTLPRCPHVNANHPIDRNYGNSVWFLANIPNGTAAESSCYSVFWKAIDFCRPYTSKKISMWALPTVPLFAGKSRFFLREMSL